VLIIYPKLIKKNLASLLGLNTI